MSSMLKRSVACTALAAAIATPAVAAPTIAGCPLFPSNHVLNTRVDTLPVHPRSAAWIANSVSGGDGANRTFYMDFGAGLWNGAPIGIPFVVVDGSQAKVPVSFTWADESDPGPYPIPPNAPIEGVGAANAGGDRHVLVVDRSNCKLYETYNSWPQNGGTSWTADSGALFDLRSNALRPAGWTSADAAGLAMVPYLVRYDDVATGVIEHALRFTVPRTQRAYIWPARHFASTITDPNVPPMGARLRLKASVDITRFTGESRVIAQAMKTYGIVLADNGSAWFVNGVPDERWNNTVLRQLTALRGADFEVVDTSSLMVDPNSAEAAGGTPPPPPPPPPPQPAATTTSLASSVNPSGAGQAVTFTATVASATGTPSGNATFRANSVAIAGCSGVALASGSAQCSTSALAAGTHTIVAEYGGNASYAPSTSPALAQTVSGPVTVTITVTRDGRGTGTVTASNGSINCGSDCTGQVASGAAVTLTAKAKPNSVFQGWTGGGCSGTGVCTLAPTSNVQVNATFRRKNG